LSKWLEGMGIALHETPPRPPFRIVHSNLNPSAVRSGFRSCTFTLSAAPLSPLDEQV